MYNQALSERILNDDLTFSNKKARVVNQIKGYTSSSFRKQYLTDEALRIIKEAK